MIKHVFAAAAGLAIAVPALAQTPFPQTNGALTWQRRESTWDPAWFICDGINRPVVHVVGALDAKSGITLWDYSKRDFRTARTAYIVGNADAGAGSIYYPLFAYPRGRQQLGTMRALNPGAFGAPARSTTATFSSIAIGRARTECRFLLDTRLQMFGGSRSVVITRERGGYVYRSFDYNARLRPTPDGRSTAASLTLRGGQLIRGRGGIEAGKDVYVFRNGAFGYRAFVSRNAAEPGAGLSVTRGGRTIATTIAAAYTRAR